MCLNEHGTKEKKIFSNIFNNIYLIYLVNIYKRSLASSS